MRGKAADRRASVSDASTFTRARNPLRDGAKLLLRRTVAAPLVGTLARVRRVQRRSAGRPIDHHPARNRRRRPGDRRDLQPRGHDVDVHVRHRADGRSSSSSEWLVARCGAFAAIVAVESASRGWWVSPRCRRTRSAPPTARPSRTRSTSTGPHGSRDRQGCCLGRLVEVARESGFHSIIARIEATGDASRALHASCGFELVGIEREVGRKFNRWLSVAVMQRCCEPGPGRDNVLVGREGFEPP